MNDQIVPVVVFLLILGTNIPKQDPGFRSEVNKVSYCDLLTTPQVYDKKVVRTEALVGSSFHSVAVYDPNCMSTDEDNRSASLSLQDNWNLTKLGKMLSKDLVHGRSARVEFEGTFYGSGGPYGGDGTRFRFVVQRLISVKNVQNVAKSPAP